MEKNKVFTFFLVLMGLPALIYLFLAGKELFHYYRLDKPIPIESLEIKPFAVDNERYAIQATYRFMGQTHTEVIDDPLYLNAYGAEKEGEKMKQTIRTVWVNSSNLQESSLQKSLPYKKCAYALILLGLFFYFLILSRQAVNGHFKT